MLEQAISQLAGWQWAVVLFIAITDNVGAGFKMLMIFLAFELAFGV